MEVYMKEKRLVQVKLYEDVVMRLRHDAVDRGVTMGMLVEGIVRKFYGMPVGEYLAVEKENGTSQGGGVGV